MKKVLVTGANGYIGKHVVENLIKRGHFVIAADINFKDFPYDVERYTENIFSGELDIFHKLGTPDVCIHLAWREGFNHNSPAHFQDLPKHYEFINNLIQGGLRSLSVMGTMHEIGYFVGEIDENTPTFPTCLYGISKNALRQSIFCLEKSYNFSFHWLRAFYILGEDEKSKSIFSKILQAEKEGKLDFPFTSGKNKYDFIDVAELAEQIVAASLQEQEQGIINCCSGIPEELGKVVERFIKKNALKISLLYGAYPEREYDSPLIYGNTKRIKTILENQKK